MMPQWPCEVYSHRQTSVMTSRSDVASLMARVAVWTGASGSHAAEPVSSFRVREPEQQHRPQAVTLGAGGFLHRLVDRELVHAGHRRHGATHALAVTDEQRVDQRRRRQRGLPDQVPHGGAPPESSQSVGEVQGHERCSFPEGERLEKYAAIASTRAGTV